MFRWASCRANAAASSPEKSGNASPRSASLPRILPARTAAYCKYGPVSPVKLSASWKSNAITEVRVYFSMKYRSAATAIWVATRRFSGRPGFRDSTSASAFSISLSIRSSALTPSPLRPLTSTYGRLRSSSESSMPMATHVRGDSATIS